MAGGVPAGAGPGRAPGPLLVLGAGGLALAFAVDHPAVLLALAGGALALFAAAPARPSRLFLLGGVMSALGLVLLTPLVSARGELILLSGPELSLIDLEVTVEELAAGAASGVRVFTAAVLVGAMLAHLDPDRLTALAGRVAPRSALAVALSARLIPLLQRDARALGEAAGLRGLDLHAGGWARRLRNAAPLAVPLVGASLERGLDAAEAMAARGYGGGRATRLAEPPHDRAERATLALGLGLCLLVPATLVTGAGAYRFYPTLAAPLGGGALGLAALAGAALGGAAWTLRG